MSTFSIAMIVACLIGGLLVGEIIRMILNRGKGGKNVPTYTSSSNKYANYDPKLKNSRATKRKKKK